ncbi:O-methyltransferase [Kwoniella mangroviensis CBS 10435]|uniref:O-methyltransferase n=1 Tax=Kwoniella mangroviensis CBS 10435 TaxID=1331196 RepID=A0A1B9IWN1_9TREE|nr:O-methyltransferase [Kwoniella mangroviensis CBS 8507]OCF59928.1 O-methyltransferase [Kwoniella mangroviensis CBS 10435]OCF69697.1 O-methyltransferase [Kwoniella mangroviensis CBS 8507]OCF70917.1 O-methyltransferase [Kwoniella mangroviensis CBS 8886]
MSLFPNPVVAPPHILKLLDDLHAISSQQESQITAERLRDKQGFDEFMRDKFIALDQDKCWFVYQTCLSIGVKNVIEAGTSYGVSTIYLSLALSQSSKIHGHTPGKVIATENEPSKITQARKYWQECGDEVERLIDLREGNLLDTLAKDLPGQVDLLLLDIWSPLALPTLKLVQPSLRKGAVVITDNIVGSADRYKDLIEYLNDGVNGFNNLNVPYSKGLALSVYLGRQA